MRGLLFPYLFARVFLGPSFEDVALQFHAFFVFFKRSLETGRHIFFMKLRSILAALAFIACGSLCAQNVTKADLVKLESQLNSLSQKVTQLESNLERVITENVNLVEQLNIKTVTSVTDANGIQWDIVKVEPDASNNDVVISLRLTNNTGVKKYIYSAVIPTNLTYYALDSNTNLQDNKYGYKFYMQEELESGYPKNKTLIIKNVPTTCSYLSLILCKYDDSISNKRNIVVKFTGVHIPW